MFRKWSHGHSLGTGALVGLGAASYRVWLLLAVAFLLGSVATLLVVNGRRFVRWIDSGRSPFSIVAAKVATERERAKEIHSRRRRNLERSRETRDQRERREKRAYYQGAADVGAPPNV